MEVICNLLVELMFGVLVGMMVGFVGIMLGVWRVLLFVGGRGLLVVEGVGVGFCVIWICLFENWEIGGMLIDVVEEGGIVSVV